MQLVKELAQGDILLKKTYLEKYCICFLDQAYFILIYITKYYDFKHNKSFKSQLRVKSKIVKIFLLYFFFPIIYYLKIFIKIK